VSNTNTKKAHIIKAAKQAFGQTPLACDGFSIVRVEDYEKLAEAVNGSSNDK